MLAGTSAAIPAYLLMTRNSIYQFPLQPLTLVIFGLSATFWHPRQALGTLKPHWPKRNFGRAPGLTRLQQAD